jgi:hypothetical protein
MDPQQKSGSIEISFQRKLNPAIEVVAVVPPAIENSRSGCTSVFVTPAVARHSRKNLRGAAFPPQPRVAGR